MPVTQGAGNPAWSWDETLLALDLLYRHQNPIDRSHQDVQELSDLLRAAPIHPAEKRRQSFRNADGVALKLQNLLSAIDPSRGLSSSKTDREIVEVFSRKRANEVAQLAASIRAAIEAGEGFANAPDDETFVEGKILTSWHRSREQSLRNRLLRKKADEQLTCEICCFAPPALTRELRESFFEAHHIRPLSDFKGITRTSVTDLALLCASCHRFLHKLIRSEKRWFSVDEARRWRDDVI